jgi:hypothetical protein
MSTKFYRVKMHSLDKEIAINASDIRAVLPLGDDKYHIWLSDDLEITEELGKRLSKLAGVTPLKKDTWEVSSTELNELFK